MKSFQLNARRLTKCPGAISIENSIFKRQHICSLFFYNKPLFSPGGIYIEVLTLLLILFHHYLLLIVFHANRLIAHHLKLQLRNVLLTVLLLYSVPSATLSAACRNAKRRYCRVRQDRLRKHTSNNALRKYIQRHLSYHTLKD